MSKSDFIGALPPELTGPPPHGLPPGHSPRATAIVVTLVILAMVLLGILAVVSVMMRKHIGQTPGMPAVLRAPHITRSEGRLGVHEFGHATFVYTDDKGQSQSEVIDLPAAVAHALAPEQPTLYWRFRGVFGQSNMLIPQEGLADWQATAAKKFAPALGFLIAMVLAAGVLFFTVVVKKWQHGSLLRNGQIAVGRVLGASMRQPARGASWLEVRYQVDLPEGGTVSKGDEFTSAQVRAMGRTPIEGDAAYVAYDPGNLSKFTLWGVGPAPLLN